jgi:hypothetical protein
MNMVTTCNPKHTPGWQCAIHFLVGLIFLAKERIQNSKSA